MLEFVPVRFQSTHPVRGATDSLHEIAAWWKFQSTHPVRGATVTDSVWIYLESFQSTHPVRGATLSMTEYGDQFAISIHAPREGCDGRMPQDDARPVRNFNPRTP